jgi:hypothetical protein
MPKNSPRHGDQWDGTDWGAGHETKNWGVEVNTVDEEGKAVYGPDRKIIKKKVPMGDGKFRDGTPQSLYFPMGHKQAGVFKGMAIILEECGYSEASKLCAECPRFECEKGAHQCCCH